MHESMVVDVGSLSLSGTEDSGGPPIRKSALSHRMSACQRHRICPIGHFTKSVFLRAPGDYARNSHRRFRGGNEGSPSEFQTEPSILVVFFLSLPFLPVLSTR
jgi:hypothetical protein